MVAKRLWRERRRKKKGGADRQCEEISKNGPLGCGLIKRVFEAHEEKKGRVAGLLFFATLSSPTRRKYTRRREWMELPLEIRRGKVAEKKEKQERRRGMRRRTRRRNTRDTLVWCTTSGLLLRNKTSFLFFLFFSLSSAAPLLKGNFRGIATANKAARE